MSNQDFIIEGNTLSIKFEIHHSIYDIVNNNKLFKKIFKVNKDLLKNYYNDEDKHAFILKNITDENINEYKYIAFKVSIVNNAKYDLKISGSNVNKFFEVDDNIEKILIDKIQFNIYKKDNKDIFSFKLIFKDGEYPNYTKKIIGKVLNKSFIKFRDSLN